MLKLFFHDVGWALLLLPAVVLAVLVAMLLWGKRESRLLAACWGVLIGAVVLSPGWYLVIQSWRDRHAFAGLAGGVVIILEVLNVGLAVLVGVGAASLISVRLHNRFRGQTIPKYRFALVGVWFAVLIAAAIAVRLPVIQNEYVWTRADARLAPVGLTVSDCQGGQVRGIRPEFELSLKLISQRQAVKTGFADQIVAHRELEYLDIDQLNISDADLQKIGGLPNLKSLEVGSDLVTDSGVTTLGGLSGLTSLSLKCPGVTDAALPTILQLKNLEYLHLEGMQITDQGLMKLRALSKLKHVIVDSPHLTREGVAEFKSGIYEPFLDVAEGRDPVTGASTGPQILPSREELQRKQNP